MVGDDGDVFESENSDGTIVLNRFKYKCGRRVEEEIREFNALEIQLLG